MSYAVIATGGRQLRVEKGQLLRLDRLETEPGKKVTFDNVLLVGEGEGVKVGTPTLSGAKVTATVIEEARDKKIIVFKKKRRKQYRRTRGHRQYYSLVRIDKIQGGA